MNLDLRTLKITDFRSINGVVNIPLDAPIVLLHGLNGAGKTSVLSALELALTGDVEALRRQDPDYLAHLVHSDEAATPAASKSATLEVSGFDADGKPRTWTTTIADAKVSAGGRVLDDEHAQFYAERCYLAQYMLGRLLEIYSRTEARVDNALTKFVKDLLKLDELEALIDGLDAADHLRRAKTLAPLLSRADDLRKTLKARRDLATAELQQHAGREARHLVDLRDALAPLGLTVDASDAAGLQAALDTSIDEAALVDVMQQRRELASLTAAWADLPQDANSAERGRLEAALAAAAAASQTWQANTGAKLAALLDTLREFFPSLPSWTATDPSTAYADARARVGAELTRLQAAIVEAQAGARAIDTAAAALVRAQARLQIVDEQIRGLGDSAGSLARALAEITPHVHGDDCPVCGRDYGELEQGSLASHLQQTIADLTEQAGRLAALATERSETQSRASDLSRRHASAVAARVNDEALLALQQRLAGLAAPVRELNTLEAAVGEGAEVIRTLAEAEGRLAALRDRDRRLSDLRAGLSTLASSLQVVADDTAGGFDALAAQVGGRLATITTELNDRRERRAEATQAAEALSYEREQIRQARTRQAVADEGLKAVSAAFRQAEDLRADARQVAETARGVRKSVVERVFSEALNTLWRDLFVRLAPTEPFVPAFVLPEDAQGVVAKLETRTRAGEKGGTPGAMLSAGNLNTAALTLFLALHLSVEAKVPWLVLDDPVQSMDEVHIAQFAALLRTLAKDHRRKIFIAVHERALFEYLRLELAPAFEGDQLVTVELRRSASEETIAKAAYAGYEGADIVAAA